MGVLEAIHDSKWVTSCEVDAWSVPWISALYVTCRGDSEKQINAPLVILSLTKSHWQRGLNSFTILAAISSALLIGLSSYNNNN